MAQPSTAKERVKKKISDNKFKILMVGTSIALRFGAPVVTYMQISESQPTSVKLIGAAAAFVAVSAGITAGQLGSAAVIGSTMLSKKISATNIGQQIQKELTPLALAFGIVAGGIAFSMANNAIQNYIESKPAEVQQSHNTQMSQNKLTVNPLLRFNRD